VKDSTTNLCQARVTATVVTETVQKGVNMENGGGCSICERARHDSCLPRCSIHTRSRV